MLLGGVTSVRMWLDGVRMLLGSVSGVRMLLGGVSGVRMWLDGVRMLLGGVSGVRMLLGCVSGVRMWLDGRDPGLQGEPPCFPELVPFSAAVVVACSLLLGRHQTLQAGKETTHFKNSLKLIKSVN